MATLPCIPLNVTNVEAVAEQLSNIIARALDYPKRATNINVPPALIPSTWNGIGSTPPGWTKRPTSLWLASSSLAAIPVSVSMQAALAGATAQARLTPLHRATLNAALATVTNVDLATYTEKCVGDKRYPWGSLPTFFTAWDAWCSDHARFQTDYGGTVNSPDNVYLDYPHRQPFYGWDQWAFPGDPVVSSQTTHDQRLLEVAGAADAISYDWYPWIESFNADPANRPPQAYINTMAACHKASPNKGLISMFFMIDPLWFSHDTMPVSLPGGYGKAASYRAALMTYIADSCYWRPRSNRPIIGIFGYTNLTAGAQRTAWLAQLDSIIADVTATVGVAPDLVIQDFNQTAAADMQSRGARWKTVYGPNPTLTGAGQQTYYQQQIWDRGTWSSSGGGIQLATSVVLQNNGLPRSGGARPWTEQPTALELIESINAAQMAYQSGIGKAEILCLSSFSEHSETGTCERTVQDGTKFFDCCRIARGVSSPATIADRLSASSLQVEVVGAGWSRVVGQTGAHDTDIRRSSTASDRLNFPFYQSTQLTLMGPKGPGLGTVNIYLDNVLQASGVSLAAGVLAQKQTIWASSALSKGLHTLGVEVASGQCDIDYVEATITL